MEEHRETKRIYHLACEAMFSAHSQSDCFQISVGVAAKHSVKEGCEGG